MKKIILPVVFTLIGLALIGYVFILSGSYNVSAMEPDSGLVHWVLETTSDNSVDAHSADIIVPELNKPEMIKEGIAHYKEMCESCHGGPGKEETELAIGLNPKAPNLVKWGGKMNPAKMFWVTKNGIKMTGMPAWGKTHSDDKIWSIVAAVKKLNEMSPAGYDAIKAEKE
ncbi:MAG TPA: cytochrome c [Ignavibacteriaceae bacterium]|nr:cytochrome c [Ignavibacteriaceae bacterium]